MAHFSCPRSCHGREGRTLNSVQEEIIERINGKNDLMSCLSFGKSYQKENFYALFRFETESIKFCLWWPFIGSWKDIWWEIIRRISKRRISITNFVSTLFRFETQSISFALYAYDGLYWILERHLMGNDFKTKRIISITNFVWRPKIQPISKVNRFVNVSLSSLKYWHKIIRQYKLARNASSEASIKIDINRHETHFRLCRRVLTHYTPSSGFFSFPLLTFIKKLKELIKAKKENKKKKENTLSAKKPT